MTALRDLVRPPIAAPWFPAARQHAASPDLIRRVIAGLNRLNDAPQRTR